LILLGILLPAPPQETLRGLLWVSYWLWCHSHWHGSR